MGLVRLVRSEFKRYRLHELMDLFKDAGTLMGIVIENLCIASLDGRYSMNDLDQYINRSDLRREFYCGQPRSATGRWIETYSVCETIWRKSSCISTRLCAISILTNRHTYVDGFHVKRYGPKGHNVSRVKGEE